MLISDQFGIIQNLQTSPMPQTSFLVGTVFAETYSKTALGVLQILYFYEWSVFLLYYHTVKRKKYMFSALISKNSIDKKKLPTNLFKIIKRLHRNQNI